MAKLKTVIAAGMTAAALTGAPFAQAADYFPYSSGRVVTTYPYAPQRVYVYDTYVVDPYYPQDRVYYDPYFASRQWYMEQAGRRYDAMTGYGRELSPYEADRYFGHPRDPNATYYWDGRWNRWGADRVGATQDSNPSDFATGIYNPKGQ
jgi:hypothetical protein